MKVKFLSNITLNTLSVKKDEVLEVNDVTALQLVLLKKAEIFKEEKEDSEVKSLINTETNKEVDIKEVKRVVKKVTKK